MPAEDSPHALLLVVARLRIDHGGELVLALRCLDASEETSARARRLGEAERRVMRDLDGVATGLGATRCGNLGYVVQFVRRGCGFFSFDFVSGVDLLCRFGLQELINLVIVRES